MFSGYHTARLSNRLRTGAMEKNTMKFQAPHPEGSTP